MEENKNSENKVKSEKDGILELNGYTFWHNVKIVKSYVINYLEEKFHDSLIIPEFNNIDLAILNEDLPVEIQSTRMVKRDCSIQHSGFENMIRRQIEDNIENYGRCWFFFDSEYHRYLSELEGSNISINLDWFAKYVKDEKLKVFTVRYDGIIKELKYEDLEFIRKLSYTCKLDYDNDKRILNRNKMKIMNDVMKGYKFTQYEINEMIDSFANRKNKGDREHLISFLIKETNPRKKLYGYIFNSVGSLESINNVLDMNAGYEKAGKVLAGDLGIFEIYRSGRYDRTKFKDEFNICQYFPGYIRNKDKWDKIKNKSFSDKQLRELFTSWNSSNQRTLDF